MALPDRWTFTPTTGTAVAFHGATGPLRGLLTVVDRFRRPAAIRPGYQLQGSDAPSSAHKCWKAIDTAANAKLFQAQIEGLKGTTGSLTYNIYSNVKVMIVDVEVESVRAVKGTDGAGFLVEATVTVEVIS